MVRNSPCSVCFLTSKPFRIGGIDLFVVCLVSIGCSLLFISFYQFFSRRTRKTNFFRPISLLIIFLFFFYYFAWLFFVHRGAFWWPWLCVVDPTGCFSKIQNVGCQKISQDNLIIFVVSSTESVDSLKALGKGWKWCKPLIFHTAFKSQSKLHILILK